MLGRPGETDSRDYLERIWLEWLGRLPHLRLRDHECRPIVFSILDAVRSDRGQAVVHGPRPGRQLPGEGAFGAHPIEGGGRRTNGRPGPPKTESKAGQKTRVAAGRSRRSGRCNPSTRDNAVLPFKRGLDMAMANKSDYPLRTCTPKSLPTDAVV